MQAPNALVQVRIQTILDRSKIPKTLLPHQDVVRRFLNDLIILLIIVQIRNKGRVSVGACRWRVLVPTVCQSVYQILSIMTTSRAPDIPITMVAEEFDYTLDKVRFEMAALCRRTYLLVKNTTTAIFDMDKCVVIFMLEGHSDTLHRLHRTDYTVVLRVFSSVCHICPFLHGPLMDFIFVVLTSFLRLVARICSTFSLTSVIIDIRDTSFDIPTSIMLIIKQSLFRIGSSV